MSVKIKWFSNNTQKNSESELIKHIKSLKKKNYIEKFEREISKKLNVKFSVLVSSGSNAIILALFSLKLKYGDEIIVSNRTWIATAHAAYVLGLKVKLVDCLKEDTKMNIREIKKKITKKTKVIIVTHMNGRANDMKEIKKICKTKNLFLIEDACQALFSKYKKKYLGTFSDLGCFSLGSSKIINTYQGGFLVTNNRKNYSKLKLIRNHGVINNFSDKWSQPGFNFKYNHFQALIGYNELKNINVKVKNSKKIYKLYHDGLKDLRKIKIIKSYIKHGEFPLYTQAIVDNKSRFIKYMKSKSIEIRPLTPSLNFSDYLNKFSTSYFKNSDYFHKKGVYLPSGPTQIIKNIKKTITEIKNYEKT